MGHDETWRTRRVKAAADFLQEVKCGLSDQAALQLAIAAEDAADRAVEVIPVAEHYLEKSQMPESKGVGQNVNPLRWTLMRDRRWWKVWSGPPTEGWAVGAQEAILVMSVTEHEAEIARSSSERYRGRQRLGKEVVATELELFQTLMTAIKRLEEVGVKTEDLREVANRVADPYRDARERRNDE